ncbi:TetR/AcrR family transcriptional regulator [Rhizomicrobium electricum]|uniref:HTH tetR-type domain-containing protein n=1 Tax=Rhizomicrobium electricum TaxID=480070 RepID=A0ABP3PVL0_9PROT|nr:helix-turn-helix domain-containing protein [Rhizomicrobium electricum]NIJ49739.1 hypothetical protein [Rhizomicrobium electricum]
MADKFAESITPASQPTAAASPSAFHKKTEPLEAAEGGKPKRHLRSWKRRKHDRPVEILAAVKAAIAEHGIESVRMEDVANRANVSKGTLYCYFSNKAELLAAVDMSAGAHIEH